MVLTLEKCVLFVNSRKVPEELRKVFEADGVDVRDYGVDEVGKAVKHLVKDIKGDDEKKQVKVWGSQECSWAMSEVIRPVSSLVSPTARWQIADGN